MLATRSQFRTRVPRLSSAATAAGAASKRPGHILVLGDVKNVGKLQKFVSEFYHPDRSVLYVCVYVCACLFVWLVGRLVVCLCVFIFCRCWGVDWIGYTAPKGPVHSAVRALYLCVE